MTAIDCKYKANTTFPEEIAITVSVSAFQGAILKLQYVMTNQRGQIVFEGHSEHCFLNQQGRIIRINRTYPEFSELLLSQITVKQSK